VIKVLEHIAIRLLKMVQKHINQENERNGLSDDILDLQIRLNQLVNKYNVNFNEEWKQ
jgi:hypothetical protein